MEYLIIIIAVVAVLAIAAGTLFFLRPRRRGVPSPTAPPAAPPPRAPGGTTTAGAPGATAGAPALPPVTTPAVLEEAPVPLAGRMVRLRGRLARSQTAFGSVLLSLLSREGLDDQTWEEIEDTLLAADLGVGPSRQLVDELRTQVRVEGSRGPEAVRAMLRQDLIAAIGPDQDRALHAVAADPVGGEGDREQQHQSEAHAPPGIDAHRPTLSAPRMASRSCALLPGGSGWLVSM